MDFGYGGVITYHSKATGASYRTFTSVTAIKLTVLSCEVIWFFIDQKHLLVKTIIIAGRGGSLGASIGVSDVTKIDPISLI